MSEQAPAPKPQSQDLRGVPDTVKAIQGILNAETAPPEEQKPAAEAPPEEEYQPQPNAQAENAEPEVEEQPTEGIPLDQLESIELEVTTKGEDGKDVAEKLPVKELKLGYMRQKDYQRKTAEVARQREEVAEKSRQAIDTATTQYSQQLQQLQALILETVAPELKDVDLNKLATDDPFEYVRRRNRLDTIQQTMARIQSAQTELTGKQKAEADKKRVESLTKARETLQADIPGWNDTLYHQLMKSGETYGYKAEEIASWTDPRAIKLLHAAEKGRLSAPVRPSPDKRIVAVPKTVRPGPSAENSQAQQRQVSAMKKLSDSGKLDDAAAVIASRLR